MRKRIKFISLIIVFILCISLSGAVSAFSEDAPTEDLPNSQDHPLISRFPGSYLRYYNTVNYDEFNIPFNKLDDAEIASEYADSDLYFEGQLTKNFYIIPDNYSTLEVFRNYETALKDAGFEIIAKKKRGVSRNFSNRLYEQVNFKDAEETKFEAVDNREKDAYYLAAKLGKGESEVYLSLFIGRHGFYGGNWSDGLPAVFQVIVEEKDLETDLIDVEGVMKEIESKGKASIQGIYFEHDSTNIKAESQQNIEKIAELLNENPELELYVVGHTDYTGSLEYNMDLSKRRAKALVERLVSEYNIAKERLIPAGVGPLSPELTNETETGRAENRRVELVKKN
jgi:outer membrane protein OmpA-like peptidoglycan-associated protein